jgi:PrtD family type I secretion system ABC transporter
MSTVIRPVLPARRPAPSAPARGELSAALAACRGAFVGVALMSGALNLLYLTGSFFMLEIYDRVLPSRSIPTLLGLAAIAALLYAFQYVIDLLRGRILVRIGVWLDEALSRRVYAIIAQLPLKTSGDGAQPLRDLDQIRSFTSGSGPPALFDLPWMPLYLGICFLFHWSIGLAASIGGLLLAAIALATEILTRQPVKAAAGFAAQRNILAEAARRNAEVVHAMGMATRLSAGWSEANAKYMGAQRRTADVAGGLSALSKALRMLLQSAVLGLGAYLVIKQEATAGIIIAASILTSRALAPVEVAVANWRSFVAARQSWRRLNEVLRLLPPETAPMELPKPTGNLAVEGLGVAPPGGRNLIVQDMSFQLGAGDGLGIIGPSAAGKSSLVRTLVGAWTPAHGKIRLDGAALDQWSPDRLGRHIGYLPQDVELFAGTVAQNIARFATEPDPPAIIAAAQAAGMHELILRLPDGYETQIGEGGAALSAGQRQRIGLARALYGEPFLVVLDEPNSNLDAEGEEAVAQAIKGVRNRGGIAVVVAHRPSALAAVDLVLAMADGRGRAFGPRDEVLAKVLRRPQMAANPAPGQLRPVAREEAAS